MIRTKLMLSETETELDKLFCIELTWVRPLKFSRAYFRFY